MIDTDKLQNMKDALFQMQEKIRDAKSGIIMSSKNTAPKLAIEKCIDLINYIEGNIQEFTIDFEELEEQDEIEEDDDEDWDEEED